MIFTVSEFQYEILAEEAFMYRTCITCKLNLTWPWLYANLKG